MKWLKFNSDNNFFSGYLHEEFDDDANLGDYFAGKKEGQQGDKGDQKGDGSSDEGGFTDEQILEAQNRGISVEEYIKIEEEENLAKKAAEQGKTVDELKEEIEKEALEKEAKEKNITVEELKAQKEAGKDADPFLIDDDNDGNDRNDSDELIAEEDLKQLDFLQLEDGEKITKENLVSLWKKSVEDAKKEFKLEEQSEEVRSVITHLKNHGNLMDFYADQTLREYDRFISLSPADKYLEVSIEKLVSGGIEPEEAENIATKNLELKSEEDLKALDKQYTDQINKFREQRITQITSKTKEFAEKNNLILEQKAKAERDSMKKIVQKMETYRGKQLSENAKASIIKAIDSGVFEKKLNSDMARAKIIAFFELTFSDKIGNKNEIIEANNKGYKAGFNKVADKVFSKDDKKGAASGSQQKHDKKDGNSILSKMDI